MRQLTPFANKDLLLIKWKIVFFILCVLISVAMFWATETLYSKANRSLIIAQGELYSARSAVEMIEEEEATIVEYIDRYQELSNQRIIQPEDRLVFLEAVADLRAQYDLFPIELNIGEQLGVPLQYDPSESEPGGPIDLKASTVSINYSLLHEEDLSRFLGGLLNTEGLYQTRECQIQTVNQNTQSYLYLAQHFLARCELLWYTFDLGLEGEESI